MRIQGVFIALAITVFVLLFNNCSKVELNRIEQAVSLKSTGSICTRLPSELDSKTKFLFVIDKSGSNNDTDNGAVLRGNSIEAFFNSNQGNTSVEWSMVVFNGDQAIAYNPDANGTPLFSNDATIMTDSINRLRSDADNGSTPYASALALSGLAIQKDMELHPQENNVYMIFFVSDGEPTDISDVNQLVSLVQDVIDKNFGNIYLSTAYYGPNGAQAENRLQEMAIAGEGKFVNFNNGQNWSFEDLLIKPSVEPWLIKNLVVYNLNAGYCLDGIVGTDSDGDGMCDRDELTFADEGFDPQNRFSFGDGYGDFFHWREFSFGESLPNCSDRSDEDFDFLTACEERYVRNQNPAEGIPQRAERANPDSDFDGFLDGIETYVYFTRSLAFALDPFNTSKNTWDGEAEDAGTQIAQHRNPLIRDEGAARYDTEFNLIGVNELGQSCYSFDQQNLSVFNTLEVIEENALPGMAHAAQENVVSIHFIQTEQSDPNGAGVLMYSFQKLAFDNANPDSHPGLQVSDDVFNSYVVPTTTNIGGSVTAIK